MVPVSLFCSEGGIFTHGADSNLAVSHSCLSKEMVLFKKHFFLCGLCSSYAFCVCADFYKRTEMLQ